MAVPCGELVVPGLQLSSRFRLPAGRHKASIVKPPPHKRREFVVACHAHKADYDGVEAQRGSGRRNFFLNSTSALIIGSVLDFGYAKIEQRKTTLIVCFCRRSNLHAEGGLSLGYYVIVAVYCVMQGKPPQRYGLAEVRERQNSRAVSPYSELPVNGGGAQRPG